MIVNVSRTIHANFRTEESFTKSMYNLEICSKIVVYIVVYLNDSQEQ